ncbi:MAG: glycosyltransferase [Geobacter sp.]|nr:glycosyltransferase [Geobacter sp.]
MLNQNVKYDLSIDPPFMDQSEIKAIEICLNSFERPINALEWGSGKSTLFFSSMLLKESSWLALEHDSSWFQEVKSKIVLHPVSCASIVHVQPDRLFDGSTDGDYATFRNYILSPIYLGNKYDFILVDGRARVECLAVGWSLLKDKGVMVLHDAQRKEYACGIPKESYSVWVVNPKVWLEGPISTLFMVKDQVIANNLTRQLIAGLGNEVQIEMTVGKEFSSLAPPQNVLSSYGSLKSGLEVSKSDSDTAAGYTADVQGNTHQFIRQGKTIHLCLFLNTYYGAFLAKHYNRLPRLSDADYSEQKRALQETFFGDSDFYSSGIVTAGGWNAEDLIINCAPLQQAWARENDFTGTDAEIVIEQIKRLRPDVIYLQDLSVATREFLEAIRPYGGLIIGQIASPLPEQTCLEGFDSIISSFPHFVDRFRSAGITSYYQPLAFEPCVLSNIPHLQFQHRPIECSFVGGISTMHQKGYALLEYLAGQTPIQFWGYGAEYLPEDSGIRQKHHGEAWGKEMFYLLSSSKITVNRHIDVAENYANNMRLFEATGCGALLITDYKDNLNELFEIGKEVVAYRSPEECVALIHYYLEHPAEAEEIARAGQARTMRDHTYTKRMEQTAEIITRHLRYQKEGEFFSKVDLQNINYGHTPIERTEITSEMSSAWQHKDIPFRQRALVQQELAQMYRGNIAAPFKTLTDILQPYLVTDCSLLEIGCASGYYYEVLEYLLSKRISYTGVDYSQSMIDMAKDYYPKATFFCCDGANLFFADRSFSVVVSSCVLLHVPNWRQHVFETTRVADKYVVASRTPVCRNRPTHYMKKYAYGVETVELHFNESEFVREFLLNGLELLDAIQYQANPADDDYQVTYLFKRL